MNKVIILTDSTSDLSKEIIDKYDIKVIPLHVVFNEESYLDGLEINAENLYKHVDEKGYLPKTSATTPAEFIECFKKYIDEGYDIFYTGIGSKISSTYQNATIAVEEFPENRIFLSDSANLSTGIGLLVLKACKFRDQGMSAPQIKEEIDKLVPHVKVQFVIKTFDYLFKGGRCSSLTKLFGTVLRIKPMIVVRDGTLKVGKKTVGLMKKAVASMTNIFLEDLPNVDLDNVFITDSTCAEQSYEEIHAAFEKNGIYQKFENVYHTNAGCVVCSHCGPGTIGILYIMKEGLNDEKTLDQDAS